MKTLIIAEKPSVARDIAAALGLSGMESLTEDRFRPLLIGTSWNGMNPETQLVCRTQAGSF